MLPQCVEKAVPQTLIVNPAMMIENWEGKFANRHLRKHIFEAMKVGRVEKLSHQQQR